MKQRKAMGEATPSSDRPGVSDLYRRYAAWLRAALRRRFGAETADDLVQETYLRLISCETEIEIRHPKALLMRIAVNAAVDQNRRRRVRNIGQRFSFDDLAADEAPRLAPHQVQALMLKQVILSLPNNLRDVFVLSRFSGLTYEQIAEHLGISVKTVEWRMSKALAHCDRVLSVAGAGSNGR